MQRDEKEGKEKLNITLDDAQNEQISFYMNIWNLI